MIEVLLVGGEVGLTVEGWRCGVLEMVGDGEGGGREGGCDGGERW